MVRRRAGSPRKNRRAKRHIDWARVIGGGTGFFGYEDASATLFDTLPKGWEARALTWNQMVGIVPHLVKLGATEDLIRASALHLSEVALVTARAHPASSGFTSMDV